MARIRTIKPEFWTDEKIVQLPFEARLLFIGLWNFADDDGYVVEEPERIRLQVLPSDRVDCEILLDLLVAASLLDRMELADGRTVLHIPKFAVHQKISHRTPTKLPVVNAKKRHLPNHLRRAVAIKYGCPPGGTIDVACYYCGAPGSIHWFPLHNGRPSAWVAYGGMEFDHFVPENSGGATSEKNIVLSCRYCNRSKATEDGLAFASRTVANRPEHSGTLRPEGKGIEGKGKGKGKEDPTPRRVQPLRASPEPPPAPAPAAASPTTPAQPPASAPAEPHGAARGAAERLGVDFCDLGERVLAEIGIDPARWTGNFAEVQLWLNRGFDAERDVLPAVRAIAEQKRRTGAKDWPPRNLRYFTGAIERFHDERVGAPAATAPPQPPADAPPKGTVAWWRWMVGLAVESGEWPTVLGPRLTKARAQPATCPIPDAVLEEFGFPAKEPTAGAGAAA